MQPCTLAQRPNASGDEGSGLMDENQAYCAGRWRLMQEIARVGSGRKKEDDGDRSGAADRRMGEDA